jgi:hypothetical protein
MTPKEKSKELVNKFEPYMPFIDQIDYSINMDKRTRHAKQCALIAVDEVLYCLNMDHDNVYFYNPEYEYYKEVKKEIEKL